jgi:hypothetical protein
LRENFDRFNFAIHKEKEMADFRRWILAFAALVLVVGSVVPASAQTNGPQVTCSVNTTVTPTLRHEGLTELIGDILLVCTGTPGSAPITTGTVPQADISVTIGGYALSTSTAGTSGGLDALLLVDDPSPANQTVCPTPTNGLLCPVAADGGATYNQPGRYNVFQGISTPAPAVNSITFLGVPVDPPASGVLTYRITNIRIQPFLVGQAAAGVLNPVYAFVSTSSSTSITIPPTQAPVVGYVSPGLIFSSSGTNPSLLQCLSYPSTTVGTLTFAEGFPNAFKNKNAIGCAAATTTTVDDLTGCQTQPGAVYYSESGLQVSVPGGTTGLASTATELQAVITGIPAGVELWVDASNTDAQGISATIISPTPIATNGNMVEVLGTGGGSVTVVWGIAPGPGSTPTGSNPAAYPASLVFNVYTSFTGAPGSPTGSPTPNVTATVQGGFYPQVAAWANGGPVPEFGTGLVPSPATSLFTVSLCQTVLLFPYYTDAADVTGNPSFDTGFAISNTSMDSLPVGASPQTGTCAVTFYGTTTPVTTPSTGGLATNFGTGGVFTSPTAIAPGSTWAFDLTMIDSTYPSATFTGTSGYAIAVCNFQYAHGYTFVSDFGLRNFAAAYLALVIPDAPRSPNPFLCASFSGCFGQPGEQLVH